MSARLDKFRRGRWTEPPPGRFSRQWFGQALRTALWVVVITVLIWVYADIHFTDAEDVSATLRIHTDSDDSMVMLSESQIPVTFRIEGNRYHRDRFTSRLAKANSVLVFDAAGAKEYKPGQDYQERTADLLDKLDELRDVGLDVISANPSRINIHLDKLVLIPAVPVRFASIGAVLAEEPTIKPARIDLRIPASRRQSINPQKLTLATRTVDLRGRPAGQPQTAKVEVLPPPGISHARLSPRKVTVTFKVRQQTDTRKFTVTVAVQSPRAWLTDETWSKYTLQAKPPENWTRQITVVGDRIDLENLSAEKIRAYIILTDEDKKRKLESWWPGKVAVQFPAGLKVRLAEPVGDLPYRLVKRTESPTPPP